MVPRVSLLLLLFSLAASGQDGHSRDRAPEFHLREDVGRSLYSISAFAHGHRHGYEAGYIAADEDIHFGHNRRQLREKDVTNYMKYRREYGDKARFRQGFIYGFIAGYNDSFDFRPFRLPEWTEDVPAFRQASALPESDTPAGPDKDTRRRFDDGMLQGYRSAVGSQFAADHPQALAEQAASACQTDRRAPELGYCDGFVQGFLFGASDRSSLKPPPNGAQTAAGGHVP